MVTLSVPPLDVMEMERSRSSRPSLPFGELSTEPLVIKGKGENRTNRMALNGEPIEQT